MSGLKNQPPIATKTLSRLKKPTAVPKARRAASTSRRPNACAIRIELAMEKPKVKALARNITMLALAVAASASSPIRRPTQAELIDPFSD